MITWWCERDDDDIYRIDVITDDVHVLEKITDICTSKAASEDAYRNMRHELNDDTR